MRKLFSLCIITIVLFTSCARDVLNKKPLDLITDDIVWNDQALLDAYLTAGYMDMFVFDNDNDHHISSTGQHFNMMMVNGVSDESRFNHTFAGNANSFKNGGLKISGGLLEWWESAYQVIRSLNQFIDRVPTSPVDSAFKRKRIAEARFLRAYAYFAMVERYGGVTLITHAQTIDEPADSLYPQRDKEQTLYDFVISECDGMVNDLPETQPATDYGRPTRYAAMALKCRAALFAGSIAKYGKVQLDGVVGIPAASATHYYQLAYDAADQIMKSGHYSLYNKYPDDKVNNFKNLFLDETDNPEKIFVRPHDNLSPDRGGNGWTWDFFECPTPDAWAQGNTDGPYLETAEAFEHVDGSTGVLDEATITQGVWTTDQLWANKDPRFYATIYTMNTPWQGIILDCHNGILKPDGTTTFDTYNGILGKGPSTMNTGFGVMKYLDESHNNQGDFTDSKQDWIIFRLGEIILNKAEAAFEMGNTADALTLVNQIRARAGIVGLPSIDIDKIRHERQVELAFEGHRYWDLRRWRIATQVLSVNRSGLQYIYDFASKKLKLSIIHKIDGTVAGPAFYEFNYYLPITLTRTGIDKNLVENPGYN